MADEFVNLVTFRAQGIDQIELDLEKVKAASDNLLPSMERIFSVTQKATRAQAKGTQELTRSVEALGRTARAYQKTFEFSLAGLGGGNARFNQRLSYSPMFTAAGGFGRVGGTPLEHRGRNWSAMAQGAFGAGAAAGGVAGVAAFGTAVSGLSGTVPMAKLQNQFNRLAWELGNTLTPQVEAVTKRIASAANWLSRQDSGTQDMIGYGVAGAGLLGGARLAGIPVGAGVSNLARGIGRGISSLGGGQASVLPNNLALNPAINPGASQYGGVGRFAGRLGLAGGIASTVGTIAEEIEGSARVRARRRTSTAQELLPYMSEYQKKFEGMSKDETDWRISLERARLNEAALNAAAPGPDASVGERLRRGPGGTDSAKLQEVRQRQQALAAYSGAAGHRANAFVGGDFQEIGSGYYAAASAYAKAGFDQGEGTNYGSEESVVEVLRQIRDRMPNRDGSAEPNRANTGQV